MSAVVYVGELYARQQGRLWHGVGNTFVFPVCATVIERVLTDCQPSTDPLVGFAPYETHLDFLEPRPHI